MRRIGGRDVVLTLAVAALYFACAKLGLSLAFRAEQVTAVWPPTGFALAAMLRFGHRGVPGILIGAFVANATAGEPWWVAAGIGFGNTLEAVAGAALLRKYAFRTALNRVRDVILLIGAVVISPVLAATIGVTCLGLGSVQPWSSLPGLWSLWWLGDVLGGLIVTPPLLLWTESRASFPARPRRLAEAALLFFGVVGASWLVFVRMPEIPAIEYVVFPLLVWAGLRFGPIATASAAVTINAIAVAGTHAGRGPFAGAGPEHGLVLMQIFIAIAAMTGLFLGAVTAQKNSVERELRETDRRKDEFLAMLGHELRNPLAPIVHAVDLLGRTDDAEANRAADVIRRQSRHMARLVDDLLDVARINRGSVQLERRIVTVQEIVEAAVEAWRHLIDDRRQKLSVELPPNPVWIDADPGRLIQVVGNLVHNAAKFTPDGGEIAVRASEQNGSVFISVRDSGIGISADLLARAFEIFVQGPPPLDRPQGGLGLGLTLVRRLIELHGGTVEARSEGAGRGSEFVLRIPGAQPPATRVSPPEVQRPSSRRRVLVVEDSADAREMLFILLSRAGYEVKTATDGPEALEEAERFRPHVVLLDIGLPGMDGYAVAKNLRANAATASCVIVAVSGYGQKEDLARSRAAGFDLHLLKPVDRRTLLDAVEDAGRRA